MSAIYPLIVTFQYYSYTISIDLQITVDDSSISTNVSGSINIPDIGKFTNPEIISEFDYINNDNMYLYNSPSNPFTNLGLGISIFDGENTINFNFNYNNGNNVTTNLSGNNETYTLVLDICYCEDCKIELFNSKYKSIKDLNKDDEIAKYGIIDSN